MHAMTRTCEITSLYQNIAPDFYARQYGAAGMRAAWFRNRQKTVARLVRRYAPENAAILDIGCGNCLWNAEQRPVTGVDICAPMLEYNRATQKSFQPLRADIREAIPLPGESVDLVVITEVLEHFRDYARIIEEIARILRPGGVVVSSVPYSRFPGLWGIVFPLWCGFKAWRDRDSYYAQQCGHVVGFDFDTVRSAFAGSFESLELFSSFLLTIFSVVRKPRQ
ncbi:MAG: class I SAM-dependent methyltransferase [Candidatus Omnitrophica bacterium]|nr:class I SAM-dependent methyltransferase [Candidatus Omnitrophota bacterium]